MDVTRHTTVTITLDEKEASVVLEALRFATSEGVREIDAQDRWIVSTLITRLSTE